MDVPKGRREERIEKKLEMKDFGKRREIRHFLSMNTYKVDMMLRRRMLRYTAYLKNLTSLYFVIFDLHPVTQSQRMCIPEKRLVLRATN